MDFADKINQLLHNHGIDSVKRYRVVVSVLKTGACPGVPDAIIDDIKASLRSATICKEELCQVLFMYFGNKHFKRSLDQFYTPITICSFITSMLIPGKTVIDPACGTGDLIRGYDGMLTLCDTSKEVLELTAFSYQGADNIKIICGDSLVCDDRQYDYDYCVMNPPFGNKTLVTAGSVLDRYVMGSGRKKQEIGILFVELGLKLLKKGGVLFVVVPNGYLGNSGNVYAQLRRMIVRQYRLLGVVQLPDNSFARSGTGVSTSILIVHKKMCDTHNYPVFVASAKNIGYMLNKKNTPIKYKKGTTIIDNDLDGVSMAFQSFIHDNNINDLMASTHHTPYEFFETDEVGDGCILDVKRYLFGYKTIVAQCVKNKCLQVKDYTTGVVPGFTKTIGQYRYIDISSVSPPLYKTTLYSWDNLPSRAKYKVIQGDLIVSRLKGAISFAVITEDRNDLVVSNGFCVLRPVSNDARILLFANMFSRSFRTQHQSLVTGSIMETIPDDKVYALYVEPVMDTQKFSALLDSVYALNNELSTLAE